MEPRSDLFDGIQFVKIQARSLNIDSAYQRLRDEQRAEKIARTFDKRKFGTLTVSKRAGGGLYLIDGQHRHRGVCLMGRQEQLLPCLLHVGLSQAQEASLFMDLQGLRKPLHPYDKFRAALVRGIDSALRVKAVLDQLELSLFPPTANYEPNAIKAITTCQEIERHHGHQQLHRILRIDREAWPEGGADARGEMMLDGLAAFIVTHAAHMEVVNDGAFIELLRQKNAAAMIREAKAQHGDLSKYQYLAANIASAYNKTQPRGAKFVELPIGSYTKRPRRPSGMEMPLGAPLKKRKSA